METGRFLRWNGLFHLALSAVYLLQFIALIPTSWIGAGTAVAAGVYLAARYRLDPARNFVGLVACLAAFAGWGSWIVIWWMDPDMSGPVINVTGLLAALAVLLFLAAPAIPDQSRQG